MDKKIMLEALQKIISNQDHRWTDPSFLQDIARKALGLMKDDRTTGGD